MSSLEQSDQLFFNQSDVAPDDVVRIVQDGLTGTDGGELYIEHTTAESLSWDDGKLYPPARAQSQGFGLRSIMGETSAYYHTTPIGTAPLLTRSSLSKAAGIAGNIRNYAAPNTVIGLSDPTNRGSLYITHNPIDDIPLDDKAALLENIDAYTRSLDSRITNVSINLISEWKAVQIIRHDGQRMADFRPLVRLNVGVFLQGHDNKGNKIKAETSYGSGGRQALDSVMNEASWQHAANEAVRLGQLKIMAEPAPAGEVPIVMSNGWNGVLLHEAVGHGLEADFNRTNSSVFSGKIGQQVAAKGVTVVDRGDLPGRRGSLNFDDEGNSTGETVLIEDGILVGYMQDTKNAALMNSPVTGNGRRENFQHEPMPRMTTTAITEGSMDPDEIIASVQKGVFIAAVSGGQVDIVNGQYNFGMDEAYPIENGKVRYDRPLESANIMGNGIQDMQNITMVGNDFNIESGLGLDPGVGTCGKAGQGVPVGVGQPTLCIPKGINVIGTGPSF